MNIIPENILNKMAPADRAKLAKEIRFTKTERALKATVELERDIHNEFSKWLRLRKKFFSFIHADPSKRSTIYKGHPDFTIISRNRALMVEFKVPPNSLTADQLEVFTELSEAGNDIIVCTTAGEAIHLVLERFEMPPSWKEIE